MIMYGESRTSERTKNQSKANKESPPGDRLSGVKRKQARILPRVERALRPAVRQGREGGGTAKAELREARAGERNCHCF